MPNPDVKKIGKYEIQAELGQGGYGRVYRAFDPTVGRPVALKILMTEGNRDLLTRFRNEATSAGNLRHRNIVTIYDFGEYSGRPYLVMELLEGEDLTQTISSGKQLTLLQKMIMMDQVADGLECAHSNGVVHRDVKPANIRLLPDGTVKILDFGIARVSRDQKATRLTQQGDLIGTILYVSPEQFGGADADALCDIFAYGVTYFEFLTGKHPFGSSDPRSVMFKITMEDPPSLRSLVPECPESLEQILNRTLHKDRELRYQSLRDLRLDTEPLIIELKQNRARQLVAEAQQLSTHETPQEAIALINDALNLDPGNREARQLREVVQRTLQKKALQPRIDGLLETAQEQLAKRAVSQAVQTLESAHKLDQTDARIRDLLESSREQLKVFKEAARLAVAALSNVNRGEWATAFEKASEAARLDWSNREASRALDAVQKYERDVAARIDSQIVSGDLDLAISGLQDLAALHPDSADIRKRLAETTANKAERDRVHAVLEQAQHLIVQTQFAEAVELLAKSGLPDESNVTALRRKAEDGQYASKRAAALAKAVEDAEAFLRDSRIDEALQEIENSLHLYPGDKRLLELRGAGLEAKAARERDVLIRTVTSDCDRLGAENRFVEALQTVEAALRKLPTEKALVALLERLQAQKKRQDRAEAVRQAIDEGQRLLEHRPEQAVEFLQKASARYPEDDRLKQLAAQAQEEHRSQRRREAVNKTAEEARQRLARNDFEGAHGVLGSALKLYPDDAQLLELRQKTLDAEAAQERQRAVNLAAQQCDELIQSAKIGDALKLVQELLRQYPDEPTLLETQRRAQEEQERTKAVRAALARATELEGKLNFESALAEIDAALARYPGEKSLKERRGALQSAQSEYARRLAQEAALQRARDFVGRSNANLPDGEIEGMIEEAKRIAQDHSTDEALSRSVADAGQRLLDLRTARAKAAAGDLEGARALSARHLKLSPQHPGFLALQTHIAERERQLTNQYRKDVEKALRDAPDVDGRLRILNEALRRYPDEPYYRNELELLNSACAVANKADSLEKAGQFRESADLRKGLNSTYPSYPGLTAQIERTTALFEKQRLDARTLWLEQIQKALHQGRYPEALELAAKAEVDFPGDFTQLAVQAKQGADRRALAQRLLSDAKDLMGKAQWPACQDKLREAMESARGDYPIVKQVMDAHTKYARASISSGNWRAADALLQQASTLNPGFEAPADLRSKIEESKRLELVEQALSESQRLQESGDLKAALDAVRDALEIHPGESRLTELKTSLENALRETTRQQEKARSLEELRRLEAEARETPGLDELQRILERAQLIAKVHPKDGDFTTRVDSILKQVEALRRGRKLLDESKFDEAEKTANEMLARFEGHAAFSALKRDVQNGREQAGAAYRDEIARRLGAERDPGRREGILTEAFRLYPDEAYFQQELVSLRETQQLVARLLKDARDAEKAGRYEEAIRHWEKLRTLDTGHPNLDKEVERLGVLRASARAAALETALKEVRGAIEQRNLPQADHLLSRVEAEFVASDDGTRLRARLDALIAAMRLADVGRGLFLKGQWADGSAKFLQAARRVPNETKVVEDFLGELIQNAEAVLKSDWRAADSIVQAARELKPDSEKLAILRAGVDERRRKDVVAAALKESQEFQAAGTLRSAEASIQKALALYPTESRLAEQLARIQSALAEAARLEKRNEAMTELAAIAKEADTTSLKRLRKAGKQIDTVVVRNASDREVQERASEVRNLIDSRISELEAPPSRAAPPSKADPQSQGATASAEPAGLVAEPASGAGWLNRKTIVIGAVAAALIVGLIVTLRFARSDRQISVSVASEVTGAAVTIGNQSCVTPACVLKLAPGTYTLTARKAGFKTITQPVTLVARQAELVWPLTFESLPHVLQVNTNFESGRVTLDGRLAGNLRDGQFSVMAVAPGQHTIRVTGGGADFQVGWRSAIGASPELVGQLEAKDVLATVLANAGSTAAIACNCGVQNITVDGAPAGQTGAADGASSPLLNLTEGSRRLSVAGHSLILDVRPNPTLSVFLSLDRNVGTIVVETGEDNARVYLNNRVYRRTTQGGTVRIPIDVGEYTVRVEKDGFQGSPAQTVAVKKGDEARVAATLTPVPPTVEIAAAVPGAQVKVDGRVVGEIASNGALRAEVSPGEHVIELTKDDYTPARYTAQFAPGKTVQLDQGQLPMARVVRTPAPADPKQIEAQDWDRVRNSNNIESLDDYIRKHPEGAHLEEARTITARLRQEAQANQARQAEQAAWDATDKNNKAALQNFISRYGSGAHAQDAHGLISGIEKQEADLAATNQRAKELKEKEQEQLNRATADQQSIARFLATYAAAYNRMDLKTVQSMWNSMPRNVADIYSRQFRDARSLALQMNPAGQAAVTGDTAVIVCTRTLSMVTKTGEHLPSVNERVRVTLKRAGSGWLISSIDVV